jgi:hypothetical protein
MKNLIHVLCVINFTFSRSFCLNLDTNVDFFFNNYRVLHKNLSLPYVRTPATQIWVAT